MFLQLNVTFPHKRTLLLEQGGALDTIFSQKQSIYVTISEGTQISIGEKLSMIDVQIKHCNLMFFLSVNFCKPAK